MTEVETLSLFSFKRTYIGTDYYIKSGVLESKLSFFEEPLNP